MLLFVPEGAVGAVERLVPGRAPRLGDKGRLGADVGVDGWGGGPGVGPASGDAGPRGPDEGSGGEGVRVQLTGVEEVPSNEEGHTLVHGRDDEGPGVDGPRPPRQGWIGAWGPGPGTERRLAVTVGREGVAPRAPGREGGPLAVVQVEVDDSAGGEPHVTDGPADGSVAVVVVVVEAGHGDKEVTETPSDVTPVVGPAHALDEVEGVEGVVADTGEVDGVGLGDSTVTPPPEPVEPGPWTGHEAPEGRRAPRGPPRVSTTTRPARNRPGTEREPPSPQVDVGPLLDVVVEEGPRVPRVIEMESSPRAPKRTPAGTGVLLDLPPGAQRQHTDDDARGREGSARIAASSTVVVEQGPRGGDAPETGPPTPRGQSFEGPEHAGSGAGKRVLSTPLYAPRRDDEDTSLRPPGAPASPVADDVTPDEPLTRHVRVAPWWRADDGAPGPGLGRVGVVRSPTPDTRPGREPDGSLGVGAEDPTLRSGPMGCRGVPGPSLGPSPRPRHDGPIPG